MNNGRTKRTIKPGDELDIPVGQVEVIEVIDWSKPCPVCKGPRAARILAGKNVGWFDCIECEKRDRIRRGLRGPLP